MNSRRTLCILACGILSWTALYAQNASRVQTGPRSLTIARSQVAPTDQVATQAQVAPSPQTAPHALATLDVYARRYLVQHYVEQALEVRPEHLVIDTARVDCTTLVEYCLARRLVDAARRETVAAKHAEEETVAAKHAEEETVAGMRSGEEDTMAAKHAEEVTVAGMRDAEEKTVAGMHDGEGKTVAGLRGGEERTFADCVGMIRYREYGPDQPVRYADRLHYATEWVYHAEALGLLEDISEALGGVRTHRTFSFMSRHPASYPALADAGKDPVAAEDLRIIRDEVEPRLSRLPFIYIPRNKVAGIQGQIRPGDIILFTTGVEGLDVSHMAIAVRREDGKIGFIHASSAAKKVIVDPKTIAEYVLSRSSVTGIKVVRPR